METPYKLIWFCWILLPVISLGMDVLADRHVLVKRSLFAEPVKDIPGPEKNYTGFRVRRDSKLVVYHHEQTIGVVELGNNRELLNCELLEVRTKPDRVAAIVSLHPMASLVARIPLADMHDLMQHCQLLDRPKFLDDPQVLKKKIRQTVLQDQRGIGSFLSLVAPNTKWCGAGDTADTYYDLGPDKDVDKCCRTHDLCPVKVLGFSTQYNLTNRSFYTKSHCDCDDIFYKCLKKVGSNLSNFLGIVYFNVAKPDCVEDTIDSSTNFIRRRFASRRRPF